MAGLTIPVLWICGPRGAGKSTVAWEIFTRTVRGGEPAAYVDLAQIGFWRPGAGVDHRVRAASLGAMLPGLRAAGARRLILSGTVTDPAAVRGYTDALPASTVTLCGLHANPATLTERILLRGNGNGPPIPGYDLRGLPRDALLATANLAAMEPAHPDTADLCVDTDGLSVGAVVDRILHRTS